LPQLPALTALRFLAALLVFLFHFAPRGGAWEVVGGEGHVGVNIFFVLSGFLITLRYGDRLARPGPRLGDYFLRRAARILPLYYVVFVLASCLAGTGLPLSWSRLPEWTLTQALFSRSLDFLVVTTGWTLTVEECFYALAPLLFRANAGAQERTRRGPMLASALLLAVVAIVLYGMGAVLWTALDGRGPGFLSTPRYVSIHTLFGRFYDFAAGIFAALLFRRRSAGTSTLTWLDRPGLCAAATVAAVAAIVGGQAGMHAAGGMSGPSWLPFWLWNLELAPAAALLVLSLTSPVNPLARALGAAPWVYLGKISYALYLVQYTPLGKGLFYPVLPRSPLLGLALLYVGQSAVSALLYELVEEPTRRFVLRRAGRTEPAETAEATAMRRPIGSWRLAGAVAAVAAIAVPAAILALPSASTRGPATLAEVLAASPAPDDVLRPAPSAARPDGDAWLVRLPEEWGENWASRDARAPSALYVFGDGTPIPFTRGEPKAPGPAAFFRGPRKGSLALRVASVPGEIVIVRERPAVRVRLALARWR
jgi:peptidoglycan/LPS O-acetylase OafA/YrhL